MSRPRKRWLESGKQDTSPGQAEVVSVVKEGLEWGMVAHTYNLLGRLSQED